VVWGIASGSQMILLDGVYGFVGVLTSLVLLYGATVATSEPTARYPFGRESMTPLVIGVQGFVLLATLFYAAVEAAFTIVAGGSEVTAGSGILYGMVATVGSLGFWTWIHRKATASEILRSEAVAWKVAAFRGLGMMAGFSLMLVLAGSAPSGWSPTSTREWCW
jgi:predicted Co/Zn/Cd cation transporter (cation efflux family)